MTIQYFKLYLAGIIFGIIQMSADLLKAVYKTDYFMIAFMGLMFIVMIRLLIWAMREHKRERMKYGNQSQSHK